MNLFFIHTPFQLLVAQNLIKKKALKKNIALFGNTGLRAEHFYKTFEIMIIDELWSEAITIGDLNKGIYSFKSPVSSYINLFKFSNTISNLIKSHKINALYFGDINHPAYVFLAEKYQFKKKIYFFEEGLSHYLSPFYKKKFENSYILKFKKNLTDKLIYRSLGVSNFSKYIQAVNDVDFNINIIKKYNVLPIKKTEYDEIIDFVINYSDNFKNLIANEIEQIKGKREISVLYLSSTSTIFFSNPIEDEIELLKTIINRLKLEEKTTEGFMFYIKFHPKDTEFKKNEILKALKDEKVYFWELSRDTVYPVEALYNQMNISYLFGYGSSAQLYSEVINPRIKSYNLFYILKNSYQLKNDKNVYPKKCWDDWETLYMNIFKKSSRKFTTNEEGRNNM